MKRCFATVSRGYDWGQDKNTAHVQYQRCVWESLIIALQTEKPLSKHVCTGLHIHALSDRRTWQPAASHQHLSVRNNLDSYPSHQSYRAAAAAACGASPLYEEAEAHFFLLLLFFLSLLPRATAVMIWGGCDVTLELPHNRRWSCSQVSKQQHKAELTPPLLILILLLLLFPPKIKCQKWHTVTRKQWVWSNGHRSKALPSNHYLISMQWITLNFISSSLLLLLLLRAELRLITGLPWWTLPSWGGPSQMPELSCNLHNLHHAKNQLCIPFNQDFLSSCLSTTFRSDNKIKDTMCGTAGSCWGDASRVLAKCWWRGDAKDLRPTLSRWELGGKCLPRGRLIASSAVR